MFSWYVNTCHECVVPILAINITRAHLLTQENLVVVQTVLTPKVSSSALEKANKFLTNRLEYVTYVGCSTLLEHQAITHYSDNDEEEYPVQR